jgi:hypothetical protein
MADTRLTRPLPIWLLRIAWVTLPVTAGPAAGEALRAWSDAPRVAAEVLLWLGWAVGLLACIAPRPVTLAVLRAIAPAFVVVAVLVAVDGSASTVATVGAVVATLVAAVLASGHDIAIAADNSVAYGDEVRVPLRTPPALFLGPLPLARALVVLGVVAPVLLLADRRILVGLVTLVAGVVIVLVLGRSLLSLAGRWAVLVPAGFVVVDPMTLLDPVLFLRERITALVPIDTTDALDAVTDLRLGAVKGSLVVRFDEEAEIFRAARRRTPAATVRTGAVCVALVRRDALLAIAAGRRLPVR